jgi:hypothetical protein
MKIKVLYSHYNTQDIDFKYRPSWFSYENCFKNFLAKIEDEEDVELHLIYDTTRGGIEQNWINNYKDHFILHEIVGGTMFGAAKEMYQIAKDLSKDMSEDDLFYFMENDYLHVDWVHKIKDLFSTFNLNGGYVTLYDHNDKYTWMHLYENLVSKIFVTNTSHWRTVPNTCGSYVCFVKTFLEDYDIHSSLEGDANRWLWLEQNRGRFLLSPLPSLSTHCMETLLAPTVNWEMTNEYAKIDM